MPILMGIHHILTIYDNLAWKSNRVNRHDQKSSSGRRSDWKSIWLRIGKDSWEILNDKFEVSWECPCLICTCIYFITCICIVMVIIMLHVFTSSHLYCHGDYHVTCIYFITSVLSWWLSCYMYLLHHICIVMVIIMLLYLLHHICIVMVIIMLHVFT